MNRRAGLAICVALLAAAGADNATNLRIYSYDPANPDTLHTAGALTFEFTRRLVFTTILRVLATEGEAKAEVSPANEKALGPGGLAAVIGPRAIERDLYEVLPREQGAAMIAALCPTSHRAWLAVGRLKANRSLRVYVLGDDTAGPTKICRTLDYNFHGEWRLPSNAHFDPGPIEPPQFPQ